LGAGQILGLDTSGLECDAQRAARLEAVETGVVLKPLSSEAKECGGSWGLTRFLSDLPQM
jgi:hypothetical protein